MCAACTTAAREFNPDKAASPERRRGSVRLARPALTHPIDQTAGLKNRLLAFRERMANANGSIADVNGHELALRELVGDLIDREDIPWRERARIGGILEGQREHSEVDEILPMDAGKALSQNQAQS